MARLKIAPQRGHAVALAEIMARQAGHDVILVMALPRALLFVQSISLAADLHYRQASPCVTLQSATAPGAVGLSLIRDKRHPPSWVWFAVG